MEWERTRPPRDMRAASWALLCGNFAIGCGVMVVPGTLNDLVADLHIRVTQGGHLIAIAALMMGLGAPLLAWRVSGWDRRAVLSASLAWYGLGHLLCALSPNLLLLTVLRAATVLAAAVFTPQAAATMGHLSAPSHRGRSITFVFMGWSLASVAGLPLASWIGAHLGWRSAMLAVSACSCASMVLVWRSLPHGIRPPAISLRSWAKIARSPLSIALVLVTAFQSAGQYSVLAYAAAYYRAVFHASPIGISLMFAWFGALALSGNVLLNRAVDQFGAAKAVTLTLALMASSLLMWPLAASLPSLALVMVPWALSGFATNSGQQARLGGLSPRLTPALMALNTSAIYLGQAMGASAGAWVLSRADFPQLHWVGLGWMCVALLLSVWGMRQEHQRQRLHEPPDSPSPCVQSAQVALAASLVEDHPTGHRNVQTLDGTEHGDAHQDIA